MVPLITTFFGSGTVALFAGEVMATCGGRLSRFSVIVAVPLLSATSFPVTTIALFPWVRVRVGEVNVFAAVSIVAVCWRLAVRRFSAVGG